MRILAKNYINFMFIARNYVNFFSIYKNINFLIIKNYFDYFISEKIINQ